MKIRLFLSFLALLNPGISESKSLKGILKQEAREISKKLAEDHQDSITLPPQDNEVCFSPDENCDEKLRKFLLSARESIEVAIFDINLKKIVDTLVDQSFKVKVRVIVNRKLSKDSAPAIDRFRANKMMYRVGKQRGIMHHKFVLIDGKRLLTGSFNFTNGAANLNQENQVYLSNPSIVKRYQEQFEKMWLAGLTR